MGDFMGKTRTTRYSHFGVSEPSVCRHLSQVCGGARFGGPVHADIARVHGWVSQPIFRLGSGAFETVAAILLLIPKTARWAAGLIVVWMTAVILSHILVLGYGWFFIDALMVMLLAVIYVSLTRRRSHWAEHERVEIMAAIQTHQK
jgi:hypothetical protein